MSFLDIVILGPTLMLAGAAISRIAAWSTGWLKLANLFGKPSTSLHPWTRCAYCRISPVASLLVGVAGSDEGLVLSPLFPAWPFFPKLLLPWHELRFSHATMVPGRQTWVVRDIEFGLPARIGRRISMLQRAENGDL